METETSCTADVLHYSGMKKGAFVLDWISKINAPLEAGLLSVAGDIVTTSYPKLSKPGIIICGRVPECNFRTPLIDAFGKDSQVYEFNGDCTRAGVASVAAAFRKARVDHVVAFGGGKILDTGKLVADELHALSVIMPSIASTDAPCTSLGVTVVTAQMTVATAEMTVVTAVAANSCGSCSSHGHRHPAPTDTGSTGTSTGSNAAPAPAGTGTSRDRQYPAPAAPAHRHRQNGTGSTATTGTGTGTGSHGTRQHGTGSIRQPGHRQHGKQRHRQHRHQLGPADGTGHRQHPAAPGTGSTGHRQPRQHPGTTGLYREPRPAQAAPAPSTGSTGTGRTGSTGTGSPAPEAPAPPWTGSTGRTCTGHHRQNGTGSTRNGIRRYRTGTCSTVNCITFITGNVHRQCTGAPQHLETP
eukprot:gene22208-29271_t